MIYYKQYKTLNYPFQIGNGLILGIVLPYKNIEAMPRLPTTNEVSESVYL
nr:MAG TPA: hypothetical protein [Caudoviricetes sp.]